MKKMKWLALQLRKRSSSLRKTYRKYIKTIEKPPVFPFEEPAMPDFGPHLESLREFYGIKFLPDGFPARWKNGVITEHPIYPNYVLSSYISQYKENPTDELMRAIRKVADAAISRMEYFEDSLIFWYSENFPKSTLTKKFYSGLTQGRYTQMLYEAYQVTGDQKYAEAAEKIFRSLLIPVDKGGVFYEWSGGISIEEYPQKPNNFVLNGWLTALFCLHSYAEASGNEEAMQIFVKSAESLAHLLHLFDAPKYRNTLYRLTGYQYFRLSFSEIVGGGGIIEKIEMEIPWESVYDVPLEDTGQFTRWDNHVLHGDVKDKSPRQKNIRLNLMISKISYPKENRLIIEIHVPAEITMQLQTNQGEYNPLRREQINSKDWVTISTITLKPGLNKVVIPIPWEYCENSSTPTCFKEISGSCFNVYHYIHIDKLRQLYEITKQNIFLQWADKWEDYANEWPDMAIYEGLEHVRLKAMEKLGSI